MRLLWKSSINNLKNAVAFGYPIQQIEYVAGYEWGQLKVIFNDDRFMALRPSFHPPKVDEYTSIEEENNNGYQVINEGYVDLTFDTEEIVLLAVLGYRACLVCRPLFYK